MGTIMGTAPGKGAFLLDFIGVWSYLDFNPRLALHARERIIFTRLQNMLKNDKIHATIN